MALLGLHHLAIIGSDYPRSRRFNVETLGLRIIAENYRADRHSYKLDLALPDGVQIELFSFPNPRPRPTRPEAQGLRHLAFLVSDLDAELSRLALLGIPAEPISTDEFTGRRFTFVKDPDDLPIEFYEA